MPDQKENDQAHSSRRIGRIRRVALLSLAGVVVILEIGLRVYYAAHPLPSGKSASPDYSYELVGPERFKRISQEEGWIKLVYIPYLTYKNLPNQHTELFNINALGLRGGPANPRKEESVYRIIMTGNSATFGVGASSDQATVPYLLEQVLNSRGAFAQRVEVLNAGVIGYLTVQELAYLETELIDFGPDLIIAYNGYNDFLSPAQQSMGCTRPLENPQQMDYPLFFYEMEQAAITHIHESERSLVDRAMTVLTRTFKRTALSRLLHEKGLTTASLAQATARPVYASPRADQAAPTNDALLSECVEKITGNYQSNLRKIAQLSADWGVKLLLVVQPELSWKSQRSADEADTLRIMRADLPWYEGAVNEIYAKFPKSGQSVAAEYRVGFLDLRSVFDSHPETVFFDLVHLGDSGNEIVAQALADYLTGKEKALQR